LMLYLLWRYASHHNRLLPPDFSPTRRRMITTRIVATPLMYIVAMLISFTHPMLCLVMYALVPLGYVFPASFDHPSEAEHKEHKP